MSRLLEALCLANLVAMGTHCCSEALLHFDLGTCVSPDFARPFGSFMSVEPFSLSEGVIMCVLISLEFACTGNLSGKCLLRWAGELFVPDVAAADSHEEKGAAVQGAAASSAGACSCGRH